MGTLSSVLWRDTSAPQFGACEGNITVKNTSGTGNMTQIFTVANFSISSATLSFKWRKWSPAAQASHTIKVEFGL
jgi:hypothetical protein